MTVSVLERYHYRKVRVRQKVSGTPERPRLSVYKGLKHIYAQLIDDSKGHTLVFVSTCDPEIRKQMKSCKNKKAAQLVGKMIAEKSLKEKIKRVVFDRGGRIYHGCVKAVADGAREGGLEF